MTKPLPSLALIWLHLGKNRPERLQQIRCFDYPKYETVEVQAGNPAEDRRQQESEVCVFWADDDKPVGSDFLRGMVEPLMDGHPTPIVHYWEGNAMCLPRNLLGGNSAGFRQSSDKGLWHLLNHATEIGSGKVRVVISSAERLAPLTMDPVGQVS